MAGAPIVASPWSRSLDREQERAIKRDAAFAVGATNLLVILFLKGRPRVPGLLVAVLGATAVAVLGRLGGAWQATRRRTCGA